MGVNEVSGINRKWDESCFGSINDENLLSMHVISNLVSLNVGLLFLLIEYFDSYWLLK